MSPQLPPTNRWFVINPTGEQVGPLSWADIMLDMETGTLSHEDLAWTASMVQWQPIQEIVAGKRVVKKRPEAAIEFVPSPARLPRALSESQKTTLIAPKKKRFYHSRLFQLTFVWILAMATGAGFYFFLKPSSLLLVDELGKDLPVDDLKWVQKYFKLPHGASTPPSLISISRKNGLTPLFYFFASLPDGAEIEAKLEGNKATLVGRTHYLKTQQLKTLNGWAKSEPFTGFNRSLLAKGAYTITFSLKSSQSEISKRSYFLIGPKDEAYRLGLSQYHEKLHEQAQTEQSELRQYLNTIENQLTEENQGFHAALVDVEARPAGRPIARKSSSEAWEHLQENLTEHFATWTAEKIENEFYYYELYPQLKNLEASLRNLHEQHENVLKLKPINPVINNSLFDLEANLQSKILELRSLLYGFTQKKRPTQL